MNKKVTPLPQPKLTAAPQLNALVKGETKLFSTKNTLSQKVRMQVISLIQERLADSIDLALQAKQAHWNVKGPNFMSLHLLFDQVSKDAESYSDLIAERIAQLGGAPDGTLQGVLNQTTLPTYRPQLSSGHEHVVALSTALASYGESVREMIEKAEEVIDADTADIFSEISRSVDKNLWFVEAHGQTPA